MEAFSISGCLRFGWDTFKKRPWYLIGVFLLTTVGSSLLSQIITKGGDSGGTLLAVVAFVVNFAVNMLVGLGLITFILKAHEAVEAVTLADLWRPSLFWNYATASIIYGVIVGIGLVLLIIPGIIFMLMYWFTCYIVVDQGFSPIDALKESARITRGHRWDLFLLFLAVVALNIVGAILLFVGLLISVPVTMLAVVHAYRTLVRPAPVA